MNENPDTRPGSPEFERVNGRNFYPTIEQERAAYDARLAETEEAPEKKEKLIIDVSTLFKLGPLTAEQKERQDIIDERRRKEARS
tara:strand:- start:348 stop:602 length:255 start_codon:yes stop_codon:yes gene_type:complete